MKGLLLCPHLFTTQKYIHLAALFRSLRNNYTMFVTVFMSTILCIGIHHKGTDVSDVC